MYILIIYHEFNTDAVLKISFVEVVIGIGEWNVAWHDVPEEMVGEHCWVMDVLGGGYSKYGENKKQLKLDSFDKS